MGDPLIPGAWEKPTIGTAYDVIGGGTPATSNPDYWEGTIPWITSADINGIRTIDVTRYITEQGVKESATNRVPDRTLLVVTRVGLGKIAISRGTICFSQDMQGLVQDPNLILPEYSLYFLSYELQRLKFKGRGTTISGLTKKQLKDTLLPLPPYNEQRRIVEKIEELFSAVDKGVESLAIARQQLEAYRYALLKHAFDGKLTAQWRERNKDKLETSEQLFSRIRQERQARYEHQLTGWKILLETWQTTGEQSKRPGRPRKPSELTPVSPKELSELPALPAGYEYTYLANLGDLGRGKSKHRPRNAPELFGGPYPFIQTAEVKAASRVVCEYSKTYNELGLAQSKLWPAGTLCITIAANIAETAFLGFDGCFPDSVVGFTAAEDLVLPEYIQLFIESVRTRIEAYAPATAQKNINLKTLENLVVPLCSMEEQRVLVDRLGAILSVIDEESSAIETNLARADALRHAILKKAFAGKLVSQDPTDEPASFLLERIEAERVKAERPYKNTTKKKELAR